jgi:hypothetical protein
LLFPLAPGKAQMQAAKSPFPAFASGPYPTIRVTLPKTDYRIRIDPKTGTPQMPKDIVATAAVQNWPADAPVPTVFTWRVYLDWDFPAYPTHHRINNQTFTQASPLKVNLDGEIRGGLLTVVAKALLNGQEVCGQAHATILGENPPRKTVLRAYPRSRFGLIASKVGTAESGLRQFTSPNGLDPGGWPLVSRTNDVGIMQLNAPSGAISSADQVWDWRANVQRGLEMLRGKQRNVVVLASRHAVGLHRVPEECGTQMAMLNCARMLLGLSCLPPPSVPPLSDKAGSGALPGEADPDKLALSQVEREAIRRYNGGREYAYVIQPDPTTLGIQRAEWQIDPTRGGIRPTSGDPNYVRKVLLARSGLTLPPPPKPKSAHSHRSHRRHKRHR